MQCAACRRDAVVFQPYSGKHLCPVHFTKDFEAKAKRAIRKNRWLLPGDHTAVVLTGDAAQAALLVFLHKLTRDRRDVRLSAIVIDEGTAGGAGYARQAAERCGIGIFAGSFAERYGTTRDQIVQDEGAVAAGRTCQVLAGDLAAEIAAANGITRIAVATTVDDPATRFFSDLLNGTVERTLFAAETVGILKIPAIRPFMDIPKTEVYRYAELAGAGTGDAGSSVTGGESDAESVLAGYDSHHPATKFALANLAGTLAGIAGKNRTEGKTCPDCGGTLENETCYACSIRKKYSGETNP
jgi:Predicted ATPase of the PP-loop superfamily implicated in cell cycle control